MKWIIREMQGGDIVRVPMGQVYHYGICLQKDKVAEFGRPVFTSHVPAEDICVAAVSACEFQKDAEAEVGVPEAHELPFMRSRSDIVSTALTAMGRKGYDILNNNCEHFAYSCIMGISKSSQIDEVRNKINEKLPAINVYLGETKAFGDNDFLVPWAEKELSEAKLSLKKERIKAHMGLLKKAADLADIKSDLSLLTKTQYGKPVHPEFFYSVSHCKEFTAIAIAKVPVGVDIEVRSELGAGEKFGNAVRHECEADCSDYIALWTKKEAVFKKEGREAVFKPKEINTERYTTKTFTFEADNNIYVISIAADTLVNLRLNSITETEIKFNLSESKHYEKRK